MADKKTKAEMFPPMQCREGGSVTVDKDGKRTKTKVKKAAKKIVTKTETEKEKDNVD